VANVASAYITGISLALPDQAASQHSLAFALGAFIAIASKYVLTIVGRHLLESQQLRDRAASAGRIRFRRNPQPPVGQRLATNLVIWAFGLVIAWRARCCT